MTVVFNRRLAASPALIRLLLFILILITLWLPLAIPLYFLLRPDANRVSLVTMTLLFLEFLWLLRRWSRQVHHHVGGLGHYGLVPNYNNRVELVKGLSIGLLFVWLLFICEAIFGWVTFEKPMVSIGRIALEGLVISLLIGFAEELFFRGWILDELEKDYPSQKAIFGTALIFSMFHFLKPISEIIRTFPQFPALVLLGLILGQVRHNNRGRLGMSIGLHAGLVWGYYILQVGQLITYTYQVPSWVTGIDRNPLAGGMGIFFLGIMGLLLRGKQARNY